MSFGRYDATRTPDVMAAREEALAKDVSAMRLKRRAQQRGQFEASQQEKRRLRLVILHVMAEELCWADMQVAGAALVRVQVAIQAEANDRAACVRADEREDAQALGANLQAAGAVMASQRPDALAADIAMAEQQEAGK